MQSVVLVISTMSYWVDQKWLCWRFDSLLQCYDPPWAERTAEGFRRLGAKEGLTTNTDKYKRGYRYHITVFILQTYKALQEKNGIMNGAKGMKTIKVLNNLPNPNNASIKMYMGRHRSLPSAITREYAAWWECMPMGGLPVPSPVSKQRTTQSINTNDAGTDKNWHDSTHRTRTDDCPIGRQFRGLKGSGEDARNRIGRTPDQARRF